MHDLLRYAVGAAILGVMPGLVQATSAAGSESETSIDPLMVEAPAAGPAATSDFASNPCRLEPGQEAVEFSAYEDWQGAQASAEGMMLSPAFDVFVLAQPALAAATQNDAGDGDDASAQQVDAEAQRQRFFALGLAVLLNLSGPR